MLNVNCLVGVEFQTRRGKGRFNALMFNALRQGP